MTRFRSVCESMLFLRCNELFVNVLGFIFGWCSLPFNHFRLLCIIYFRISCTRPRRMAMLTAKAPNTELIGCCWGSVPWTPIGQKYSVILPDNERISCLRSTSLVQTISFPTSVKYSKIPEYYCTDLYEITYTSRMDDERNFLTLCRILDCAESHSTTCNIRCYNYKFEVCSMHGPTGTRIT